jgi:hypothetical protein
MTTRDFALAVENVALSGFGRVADDRYTAPSGFAASVQSYRGRTADHALELAQLKLTSSLAPSAETVRIAVGVSLGAGKVVTAGEARAWELFDLQSSLSGVPKAALAKYSSDMHGVWDSDALPAQRALLATEAASEFVSALAQAEPVFAIDKLEARGPAGNVAATVRLRLDKSRWHSETAAWGLVNAVMLDGKVSLSRALALDLLGTRMRDEALLALRAEGRPPTPENVRAVANAHAERSLAQLAMVGLVKDGEPLEFELVARNGVLTVNGLPANALALR